MKVIIIDDDQRFANILKDDFYKYFQYFDEKITIELKCDDFLNIDMEQIDIAFIDIDLNVCNGINIAKYLRQLHPQLIIIFVSRREELVFQTFSTGVFNLLENQNIFKIVKLFLNN